MWNLGLMLCCTAGVGSHCFLASSGTRLLDTVSKTTLGAVHCILVPVSSRFNRPRAERFQSTLIRYRVVQNPHIQFYSVRHHEINMPRLCFPRPLTMHPSLQSTAELSFMILSAFSSDTMSMLDLEEAGKQTTNISIRTRLKMARNVLVLS